jgi:hypothetical protein
MDDKNLQAVWQRFDERIQELEQKQREYTGIFTQTRVQHVVRTMRPIKIFTFAFGLLWVLAGSVVLWYLGYYALDQISVYFFFSALLQVLITAIAVITYGYQLALISRIDVSDPVVATQGKLEKLRSSTLWITRVLFLQLPLWTTFYWSDHFWHTSAPQVMVVPVVLTILFTFAAVWLFRNIRYENRHQPWFRLLFSGKEWAPIEKSLELIGQVKDYQNESFD